MYFRNLWMIIRFDMNFEMESICAETEDVFSSYWWIKWHWCLRFLYQCAMRNNDVYFGIWLKNKIDIVYSWQGWQLAGECLWTTVYVCQCVCVSVCMSCIVCMRFNRQQHHFSMYIMINGERERNTVVQAWAILFVRSFVLDINEFYLL